MNKSIVSKLILGVFLIFFVGSVFAAHVQTSEVTPRLVAGSTATLFTINVAITGDNNVTEIEITKPTNGFGFGTLTCGTPPTDWLTNGHTESICKYKTTTNPIIVDSNLDFTLNAVTATNSGTYVWNITTKDTTLATDDDSDTTEVDATAPTITISEIDISADTGTSATDFITKTAAQTITGTLSVGLAGGDILYGSVNAGSSWTDITSKVSGTTITWDGATLIAGTSSIKMKVTDSVGNDGAIATQSYTLDTTGPATTISGIDISNDTGTSTTDFRTKTADQNITATLDANLVEGEILYGSIDAGSNWVDITSKVTETAVFWDGATLSGTSSIKMKVTDVAANDGTITTQTYVLDTTDPTVEIVLTDDALKIGDTSLVTITFSEAVADFNNSDITVIENGTLTDVNTTDSIVWLATFTPTSGVEYGNNIITILKTGLTDVAGNAGVGSTNSNAYAIDTLAPTTTISGIDISNDTGTSATDFRTKTADQNITATLDANLVEGEILYGSIDAGSNWVDITSKVTETAVFWDGATLSGTSSIKMKVTDVAANDGTITTQTYVLDTTDPTVEIVLTDTALKIGDTSLVTITFSEAVADFNNDDITVIENGTLTDVNTTDSVVWLATFTPTSGVEGGSNVITILKTGLTDVAGNAGVGSTNSNAYAIDTIRPTMGFSLDDYALKKGDTVVITIIFSEEIDEETFTVTDINAPNGTLSEFDQNDDNSLIFTVTFTPTDNFEDFENIMTIGTNWTDVAGNAPLNSVDSSNYEIDTKNPVIEITPLSTTSTVDFNITGTIDQEDTELEITVNSKTYTAVVDGETWYATVTDALTVGTYTVAYTATDAAGNTKTESKSEYLNISEAAYGFYRPINQVPRYATLIANYELAGLDGFTDIALEHLLDSSAGPEAQRFSSDDVNCAWVYSDGVWQAIASADFDEWNFNDHDEEFVGYYVFDINYPITTGIKYIRHNTFDQD